MLGLFGHTDIITFKRGTYSLMKTNM